MNSFERAQTNLKAVFGRSSRLAGLSGRRRRKPDDLDQCNIEFLEYSMHKIRSPLASILGYAELLSETDYRNDPEFIQQSLQVIIRQGQHILQTTEDLVTAVRLNSTEQVADPAPFSLPDLLEDLVAEVSKTKQREIHFTRLRSDAIISGDVLQMRIVFNHLLDNAVKFSPNLEPIEVTLGEAEEGWIQVSIQDQGIGIGNWENSNLFRRFSRIYNDQTNGIPGNGLGLYIAKRLIEQHRGKIEFHSILGEGTTFTIYLPTCEAGQKSCH